MLTEEIWDERSNSPEQLPDFRLGRWMGSRDKGHRRRIRFGGMRVSSFLW
jgi:hypothetical protein